MKHIAIDIGQVICHLKFKEFNRKLALYAGISEQEAYDFLLKSQKAHDLGFSLLENDLNNKLYGLNLSKDQAIEIVIEWHKTVVPNTTVIAWIQKLLDQETEVALVSNIGYEHGETMKTILAPIYERCIKFFSCSVGARKPSYVYYHTFLTMYPQFKGCIYMDDNTANIEAGKLFGFDCVHFDLDKMNEDEIKIKLNEIEGQLI